MRLEKEDKVTETNLRSIAQAHADDPLNTWPDHIRAHRTTIMQNFLEDEKCLRCLLEEVASNRIQTHIKLLEAQLRAVYLLLVAAGLPGGPELETVISTGMMLVPNELKSYPLTIEEIKDKLPFVLE